MHRLQDIQGWTLDYELLRQPSAFSMLEFLPDFVALLSFKEMGKTLLPSEQSHLMFDTIVRTYLYKERYDVWKAILQTSDFTVKESHPQSPGNSDYHASRGAIYDMYLRLQKKYPQGYNIKSVIFQVCSSEHPR